MIEERDANPTADTPGRFRGRRAPNCVDRGRDREFRSGRPSWRDREFESTSLLQRVYCELRSRRMKKCRVLDAARKRGWRTEPAREPLPPQNEPP